MNCFCRHTAKINKYSKYIFDGIYCLTVAQTNEIVNLHISLSFPRSLPLSLPFPSSLQSSQAQLEEARVQREELKAEVQRLQEELETRSLLQTHSVQQVDDDTFIRCGARDGGMEFIHIVWDGLG